jgi:hypothetical protein
MNASTLRLAAPLALLLVGAACSTSSGDDGAGGSGGGGTTGTTSQQGVSVGTGAGSSGEPAAVEGITAAHNAARASVNPAPDAPMPPLAWDAELAAVAQAYADECIWEHSGGPYGENLYAAAGQLASPEQVVDSWVSEVADYNYGSNSCSGVCGHYTQVVWADSLRLGCGVTNCTTGSPFGGFDAWQNWVCNYDPPGNWVGEKPY